MWLKFLLRVELIDDVVTTVLPDGRVAIKVCVLALGQHRSVADPFMSLRPDLAHDERYTVRWFKKNEAQIDWDDKFQLNFTAAMLLKLRGEWKVAVTLMTPMVRNDPKKLLTSTKIFIL